ncbi:MAG: ABC transporter permease [Terriglobia bacterium]
MSKVWLVIKREYKTRVLTTGFVISTIAIPALIIGFIIFQVALAGGRSEGSEKIAILDEAGGLGAAVKKSLAQDKLPDGRAAFQVTEVLENPSRPVEARRELTTLTRQRAIGGYLWIPRGIFSGEHPEFLARNAGGLTSLNSLNRAVGEAIIAKRLQGQSAATQDAVSLWRAANVRLIRLTRRGETEEKGQVYLVAIVMGLILYGALLTYGITTMRSILEEKTSRIIEVLISSIRPVQLLAGKILGVAAVGLTQFLIWAISAGLLEVYGIALAKGSSAHPPTLGLSAAALAWVVVFFLGGYFLYAALYAAIGASVSSEHDAHQIQMPVTLLLAGSFLLFNVIVRDPNSTASIGLSMVPFFSPILMVMRIALQAPPLWQIAVSLLVLLLTTLAVIYASARIYRTAVLMYGKRPSLVELLRWIRA